MRCLDLSIHARGVDAEAASAEKSNTQEKPPVCACLRRRR